MIVSILIIMLCLILIVCFISYITNQMLSVVSYEILEEKLPASFDGCSIIMLSDLHNQSFGLRNETLYRKIEQLNPDYIMLAGDMIVKTDGRQNDAVLYLLKELSNKYVIYYAPGNHEKKLSEKKDKEFQSYLEKVKKMGIHYLENETDALIRGKDKILVTGLSLETKYFKKFYEKTELNLEHLKQLIGIPKASDYHILLAHHPNYFEQYVQWGADLVFSGHNHGGVVILPIIGGIIGTDFRLFPNYDFGKFEKKGKTMILSKGLGMHTIKLRMFNKPEITVVKLKRK